MTVRHIPILLSLALATIVISSCQRENLDELTTTKSGSFEPVNSTLSGRILSDQGLPMPNAQVASGNLNRYSDANGFFQFNEVVCNANGQLVRISKDEYVPFVINYNPKEDGIHFSQVNLARISDKTTFESDEEHILFSNGLAKLTLPEGCIEDALNRPYHGTIHLGYRIFNQDEQLSYSRGPIEGRDEDQQLVNLAPFQAIYFELETESGVPLKLNESANLEIMNIPLEDLSLWHFDPAQHTWIKKDDIKPGRVIEIQSSGLYTLSKTTSISRRTFQVLSEGRRVAHARVNVSAGHQRLEGWTDQNGVVSMVCPDYGDYKINITDPCGQVIFSETITNNLDHHILDIGPQQHLVHIKGKTVDCERSNLGSSYISVNGTTWMATGSDGGFNYTVLTCDQKEIVVRAFNNGTKRKSIEFTFPGDRQSINLSQLIICDDRDGQFLRYQIEDREYLIHNVVLGYSAQLDTVVLIGDNPDHNHPNRPWDFSIVFDNATPGDHIVLDAFIYINEYKIYDLRYHDNCEFQIDLTSTNPKIGDFLTGRFKGHMMNYRGGEMIEVSGEFNVIRSF